MSHEDRISKEEKSEWARWRACRPQMNEDELRSLEDFANDLVRYGLRFSGGTVSMGPVGYLMLASRLYDVNTLTPGRDPKRDRDPSTLKDLTG